MKKAGMFFFTVFIVSILIFFISNVYADSCNVTEDCKKKETTKSCYYGECLWPKEARDKARELNTPKAWEDYLDIYKIEKYPNNECTKEAEGELKKLKENDACKKARKFGTLQNWEKYLKKYPKGKCSEEAEEFMANICPPGEVNVEGHCCTEGQDWAVRSNRCVDVIHLSKNWSLIKSGIFEMGSPGGESGRQNDEGPVHEVMISRSFWLKKTEVTQGEWYSLMGNNPSYFDNCGDDCPVENVNWWESLAYCNALSRSEGFEECYELSDCDNKNPGEDMECKSVMFIGLDCEGYRLPTEAEWEYAARAGNTGPYYADNLGVIAWFDENSGDKTYPVGRKFPNKWELYDVLGNVWEWTWDWYDSGYYTDDPQTNSLGADTGHSRVIRGGSWMSPVHYCRLANRVKFDPAVYDSSLGFRPARSLDP